MSRSFGTSARIALGLVISGICLWLAVAQVPISELGGVFSEVNYYWLIPSIVLTLVSLWSRGWRWRVLLANRGPVGEYVWAQAIGCLLTNVFPLRAGEAGRVVVVNRRLAIPLVQVGASVILERAVDLAVVLSLFSSVLLVMDVPSAIAVGAQLAAVGLVVAWLGLLVLLVFGRRLTWLVRLVLSRFPERLNALGISVWDDLLVALEPLRSLRVVLQVAAWSAVTWAAAVFSFWACIEAVVPGANLVESTFALTAIALGVAVPSSPGFFGVFQYVGKLALAVPFPDRYTEATAVTIAVLNHATYYVSTTGAGLVALARLGMSLRAVRVTAPEAAVEAAQPVPTAPLP